mmetsp:Transcript_15778/g.39662  ORF Transcript_15778/g.39662 Transcript_15778/m.39662 type:complete len:212 (-) Transcript_15778:271-906(-)
MRLRYTGKIWRWTVTRNACNLSVLPIPKPTNPSGAKESNQTIVKRRISGPGKFSLTAMADKLEPTKTPKTAAAIRSASRSPLVSISSKIPYFLFRTLVWIARSPSDIVLSEIPGVICMDPNRGLLAFSSSWFSTAFSKSRKAAVPVVHLSSWRRRFSSIRVSVDCASLGKVATLLESLDNLSLLLALPFLSRENLCVVRVCVVDRSKPSTN